MKMLCKKIAILLTLVWGMTFLTPAQASVALMVYGNQSENPAYVIILEEKPVVALVVGGLHITAGSAETPSVDFFLPFDQMPRIELSEADYTQDIENTESNTTASFRFKFGDGRTVFISGLSDDERVTVYGVDGTLRLAEIEQKANGAIVHLDQLPSGYYVIRVGEKAFKIYRK